MKTTTAGKKRGPKRLEYIPQPFRHIPGIEEMTTVRQLVKLEEYLATPAEERGHYVRLGASVPQYCEYEEKLPTTTYAVTIDGVVSVLKLERDPRSAHKWFMNPRRPWNLSARFAASAGGA